MTARDGAAREVALDAPARVAAARRLVPFNHDETLDRLSALAARLLGAASAQVSLLTDLQVVVGGFGVGATEPERGTPTDHESLCTVTARSNRPLVVQDANRDVRTAHLPPVRAGVVKTYLGVPLNSDDGHVVGALCVYDRFPRRWRDDQVTILMELASAFTAELECGAAKGERDDVSLRFGIISDAARVGSWESDMSSDRTLMDEVALEICGLGESPDSQTPAPGLVTVSTHELTALVHEEDRRRLMDSVCSAVQNGRGFAEEHRLLRPDGGVLRVSVRGRPQYNGQGRCHRVVGAIYDITAKHAMQEKVEKASMLLDLMSRASAELSESLEIKDAVRALSRIVVPALADWSVALLLGEQGRITLFESWHRNPEHLAATEELVRARMAELDTIGGLDAVLREGQRLVVSSGASARTLAQTRSDVAVAMTSQLRQDSGAVLPLVSGDDIVGLLVLARTLGRPEMTQLELDTASELARRASRAITNAQSFTRERDMAAALQRSMLTDPVHPEGMEVAVRYIPAAAAAQVGGDWYDVFVQSEGAPVLVAGDAAGHDAASAAAMGQVRNILRGIGASSGSGPAALLTSVDEALAQLRVDTYATVLVARIERGPGETQSGDVRLRWSNAGHPPPLLGRSDGSTRFLCGNDLMLGVDAARERTERDVALEEGATIVLYSDGLVERRGEDIDVGMERWRAALQSSHALPLEDCIDEALASMLSDEPDDDVVVLAVRLSPKRPLGQEDSQ